MHDSVSEPSEEISTDTSTTSADHLPPPAKKFHRLFMDAQWARSTSSSDSAGSCAATVESEIDRYSSEINSQTIGSGSGITFWQDICHQQSYTLLAPLALDLLAAPASQAYVERVFSVCGDVCARKRNRMCRNLEQRAFLKMNRAYIDKLWLCSTQNFIPYYCYSFLYQ